MAFQGNWSAATNTPFLIDGVGTQGDSYVVSVAGVQFLGTYSGTYAVGEYITYQNGKWVQNRFTAHPPSNQVFATPFDNYGSLVIRPLRIEDLPAGIGGGGITNLSTTLPITGGTITSTGVIGIDKVTSLVDGYLSASDFNLFSAKQNAITTGTTSQYIRGDLSLATFPSIPSVGTWGALNYPTWVSGTPFVKMTATGTFGLDTSTYLTTNQTITLSSEATGSGTTSIPVTLSNAAVIGKVLTGYVSGTGTIGVTDTILQAIQKLNGNTSALITGVSSVNLLTGAVALTGTANRITISAANVFDIGTNVVTLSGSQAISNKTGNISQWTNDSNYLTTNQSIILSSDITGSGTTSIVTTLKSNLRIGSIGATFDGSGSVITNGSSTIITASYAGTITGWYLTSLSGTSLLSGSCTIAISKNGSDIITTGIAPTLASQTNNSGSNMTNWTTSIAVGDYFIISISGVTSCIKVGLILTTTKT